MPFARLPQRFLAVAQVHHFLDVAAIARPDFFGNPPVGHLDPRMRLLAVGVGQARHRLLVARLGTIAFGCVAVVAEQCRHHFRRRAHVAVHRVDRTHDRHLFATRLLPFGAMRRRRGFIRRPTHHHTFAVRTADHDGSFFFSRRQRAARRERPPPTPPSARSCVPDCPPTASIPTCVPRCFWLG